MSTSLPAAPAPPIAPDIDVVFTWVDGADPAHQAKRAPYRPADSRFAQETASAARFATTGEIDRAVLSVLRFAPFVRKIHLVTDAQAPPIYLASRHWPAALRDKLVLVDHLDIFRGHEEFLPTFNPRPIETLLHRVPGLAEHFVTMNDDFMLIKAVKPQDWFDHGRPILRGRWARPMDTELLQRLKVLALKLLGRSKPRRPVNKRAQAMAAAMVGFTHRYFYSHHVPHPMRRSVLEAYFAAHPEQLRGNLVHRFRDISQFNTNSLANHLELKQGQAVLSADEQLLYLEADATDPQQLARALEHAEQDPATRFICLQNLESAPDENQAWALAWMDRVIGRVPGAGGPDTGAGGAGGLRTASAQSFAKS
jgi:Stealth protein CR2, conserved region 2/Stealth protein CR1, conserved region 1